MVTPNNVNILINPNDFFKKLITQELNQNKIPVLPITESYLVNLCVEFISADHLHPKDEGGNSKEEPFAIMMHKAIQAPETERIKLLKQLGDTSLYLSGFFSDSLNRKCNDIDYYIAMGGNAYKGISSIVNERKIRELYQELSDKFNHFVDVFDTIATQSDIKNDQNILRLYDKWIKTRNKKTEKQLNTLGIFPIQDTKKTCQ